jgi:signal transduction histidine kinase
MMTRADARPRKMAVRPLLLVVDDSQAERQLIEMTLCASFPTAEVRSAGPELASEMCAGQAFDCVLVDYNMPKIDGLQLAHRLRTEHSYLATVLMTSFGDETLAAEALRSGVSDYIAKSRINTESLRRAVDRSIKVCSQARLIDEQRQELENFAYALAHDFKQPIRQITTFSEMISQKISENGDSEVLRYLAFLGDAAGRLGRLVDVMSQYTLLNQSPELTDVDLSAVAEGVRTSLAPLLAESGGQFDAPKRLPRIRGHATLMTQVLQNLVINGLRYNTSRAPRVTLSARTHNRHCVIDVRDNGIGIEAGDLTEIFKPLVRLHNTSEYPGAGLGLTLARKAVSAQGGSIWCDSSPGSGSVFHVRVPAVHRPTTSAAERARPDRVPRGLGEAKVASVVTLAGQPLQPGPVHDL